MEGGVVGGGADTVALGLRCGPSASSVCEPALAVAWFGLARDLEMFRRCEACSCEILRGA